jgi:signal transduction histidine kinase
VLAALLTAQRPADKGGVIEAGLREMALILGAERATLWERVGNDAEFRKTHRWLAPGVPVPPVRSGAMATPWISARIVARSVVRFASLAELPPEAATDLPGLRELGVRSLVIVPLTVSGAVVRALAFATVHQERDWPEALVPRITLFGEVLASVLAHDEAQAREQEARAQAAHATRVGAMGTFAASLAHELTQPLAASLANAETGVRLLDAPEPDLDELRATLGDIVADERRAGELVQKLRRFLRRGEVEHRELDLREVIEEVQQLVAREAEARGVRLRLELAEELPRIVGDRVQLQQVVVNLLSNAMDAVAAGDQAAREVAVLAARCGDGVSVEVRDAGAGMDSETLARLFQPFFTTKRNGMGLGLSISRTIVEAHGGTLSAQSAPGSGSTFRIELPPRAFPTS